MSYPHYILAFAAQTLNVFSIFSKLLVYESFIIIDGDYLPLFLLCLEDLRSREGEPLVDVFNAGDISLPPVVTR